MHDPVIPIPGNVRQRIRERLAAVYKSSEASALENEIAALVERWIPKLSNTPRSSLWNERDALLITYADSILAHHDSPLRALSGFLRERVGPAITFLHLLPFYPSTSDYGFSVVDFRAIREELGDWEDLAAIAPDYRLVFDAILNHVSQESRYVRGHLAGDRGDENFCIERETVPDVTGVTRPRQTPLFHPFPRADGSTVELWTTFSGDQVDLDFRNPAVLLEILDILLFYVSKGASMIRLDAIPYLWKESGTECIHLPQTHEIIRLMRAVYDAAAPEAILLSETNVPHAENVRYFGGVERDEAQIIYNFTLAPLLLHTLHRENSSRLTQWARGLEDFGDTCTYLNITATHDGIGMRPTEGILDEEERAELVALAPRHGGRVNYKRNSDGTSTPYELNINYFDAINDPTAGLDSDLQVSRFLLAQSIPMVLRGIPGIYIHSLLGSRNFSRDVDPAIPETFRSINREQLSLEDLEAALDDADSLRARVFNGMLHLLDTRRRMPALHPNAEQDILDLGESFFAIHRWNPGTGDTFFAICNVTGTRRPLAAGQLPLPLPATDVLTGEVLAPGSQELRPYQVRWLTPATPSNA